jgi:cellulose synthase (UDP-forming)
LVATLLFGASWLTAPGLGEEPALWAVFTLVIIYYLGVWSARWIALRRMARPASISPEPGLRVAVGTSFVPAAEPVAMLETTLRAMIAMDYPHDTWVLDEGDDPAVRALCDRLGARHFSRRRDPRYDTPSGAFAARTKYGNYNAWLTEKVYGAYDCVVTFDPDHVPERRYLTTLLGYFRDPAVAYVQAAPVHYNQRASFIARGAAEEGYAYYSSHQMASYALGHPIIVGSHTAHRVQALREVGGLPPHDAEDLYLTMLYRADGWRGVYVPQILALGTTPVDWYGYLRQQVRWSRAVLDLKLRAFPALAKRLSPVERVLNLFHGIYYLRPLAIFVLLAMLLEMLVEDRIPEFLAGRELLAGGGLLVLLGLVDRFRQRFYLDPARERGFHWRALVLQVAKWPHLVSALFDVVARRKVRYTITPKSHGGGPHRVLMPAHLLIAVLVASAAALGAVRHGGLAPLLWVFAALAIGVSLLLSWSETWRYPPPFDPELLVRRRQELGETVSR